MREVLKSRRESYSDYAQHDRELLRQLKRIRENQRERELWSVKVEAEREEDEEKGSSSNEIVPEEKPLKEKPEYEKVQVKQETDIHEENKHSFEMPIFKFPSQECNESKKEEEPIQVIKQEDYQKYNYIYYC